MITIDISDLRATKYVAGSFDCWWFVSVVLARMGFKLPESPALALTSQCALASDITSSNLAAAAGDVLVIEWPDDKGNMLQHVGVCLDAFTFAHMTQQLGVAIDRIATHKRTGRVVRHLRPTQAMKIGVAG